MISQPPPGYRLEGLARQNRAGFSCGIEALDRYIISGAGQDARRHVAATFVLVDEKSGRVAGYYSLSATGIDPGALPEAVRARLPRYEVIPATLLGRLAVDQRHHASGLGKWLLVDACMRSLLQSAEIASFAVVVDAINPAAAAFYRHFGFLPFPDRDDRLFLPMRTLESLLK